MSQPEQRIHIRCPQCRRRLTVRAELDGRRGRCPKCREVITIAADPPPAPRSSSETEDDDSVDWDSLVGMESEAPRVHPAKTGRRRESRTREPSNESKKRKGERFDRIVSVPIHPDCVATAISNVLVIFVAMAILAAALLYALPFLMIARVSPSTYFFILYAGWVFLLVTYLQQELLGVIEQFYSGAVFVRPDTSRLWSLLVFVVAAVTCLPVVLLAIAIVGASGVRLSHSLLIAVGVTAAATVVLPVLASGVIHRSVHPLRAVRMIGRLPLGFVFLIAYFGLVMVAVSVFYDAVDSVLAWLNSSFLRVVVGMPLHVGLVQYGYVTACAMIGFLLRRADDSAPLSASEWRGVAAPFAIAAGLALGGLTVRYAPFWSHEPLTSAQMSNRIVSLAEKVADDREWDDPPGREVGQYLQAAPGLLDDVSEKLMALSPKQRDRLFEAVGRITPSDHHLAALYVSPDAAAFFGAFRGTDVSDSDPLKKLDHQHLLRLFSDPHANVRQNAARLLGESMPTNKLSEDDLTALAEAVPPKEKQKVYERIFAEDHARWEAQQSPQEGEQIETQSAPPASQLSRKSAEDDPTMTGRREFKVGPSRRDSAVAESAEPGKRAPSAATADWRKRLAEYLEAAGGDRQLGGLLLSSEETIENQVKWSATLRRPVSGIQWGISIAWSEFSRSDAVGAEENPNEWLGQMTGAAGPELMEYLEAHQNSAQNRGASRGSDSPERLASPEVMILPPASNYADAVSIAGKRPIDVLVLFELTGQIRGTPYAAKMRIATADLVREERLWSSEWLTLRKIALQGDAVMEDWLSKVFERLERDALLNGPPQTSPKDVRRRCDQLVEEADEILEIQRAAVEVRYWRTHEFLTDVEAKSFGQALVKSARHLGESDRGNSK